MSSFIPATIGQKLAMCIPGVGFFVGNEYAHGQLEAHNQDKESIFFLRDQLIKPIAKQNEAVKNLSDTERAEIMSEYRTVASCAWLIQGSLTAITAVAIGALGGIIATVSAIAVGLYATWLLYIGVSFFYETVNYPTLSSAPQLA